MGATEFTDGWVISQGARILSEEDLEISRGRLEYYEKGGSLLGEISEGTGVLQRGLESLIGWAGIFQR